MISQKEIARQCGVSVITVSRALDPLRRDKVKPETRKKIESLCARENFYPSFSARSLASGCTRSVGLIVPGIGMISNSPPSAIYLEAFNNELIRSGYSLQLMPVSGSDWETIRRNALPLILSNRCDSYVTVAFSVDLPSSTPVTVLQTTAAQEIAESDFPVISISSKKAMDSMAKHLKSEGYRRPLSISFGEGSAERVRLWHNAFAANGFPEFEELKLPPSRINVSGDPAMLKVLKAHLPEMRKSDIWVFTNDQWALMAAELLKMENLIPGEDIALIGFDNVERGLPDACLSTIAPPLEKFGQEAARMVLKRIKERDKDFRGVRIELESQAIFRETTTRQ